MHWQLIIDRDAKKQLNKIPKNFTSLIEKAIGEMEFNPYFGDIQKMKDEENVWRRRVGSYRVFYEIYETKGIVYVYKIKRRTSTTY